MTTINNRPRVTVFPLLGASVAPQPKEQADYSRPRFSSFSGKLNIVRPMVPEVPSSPCLSIGVPAMSPVKTDLAMFDFSSKRLEQLNNAQNKSESNEFHRNSSRLADEDGLNNYKNSIHSGFATLRRRPSGSKPIIPFSFENGKPSNGIVIEGPKSAPVDVNSLSNGYITLRRHSTSVSTTKTATFSTFGTKYVNNNPEQFAPYSQISKKKAPAEPNDTQNMSKPVEPQHNCNCGCHHSSLVLNRQSSSPNGLDTLWEDGVMMRPKRNIPWWEIATRKSKYRSCPIFPEDQEVCISLIFCRKVKVKYLLVGFILKSI